MSSEKKLSFEEAMDKLEEIVEKLEEGDVPLEKAIAYFQDGMTLSKLCHDKLKTIEKQMDKLLQDNGELQPIQVQEEE
ncbi:exodeoxyribonuclease VII small subunit [Bacillus mesophilus]|uniref:Exodeoxyribonuclease 7 small subunit n=1 Tax=Bacillus mesophilus TaxID=1808955 RepID=A0A6M0Q5B5_9BACI|nr:exodeoxyribonuclease VII small subunit [Bacillus mesophilus]MBM7660899.1 exodeoxyribonuclease VII small subunit [Bacillus mesophilus]NEY71555.1 exodeoxyribonuclease VII small subunit [Bacillus mesophilus]